MAPSQQKRPGEIPAFFVFGVANCAQIPTELARRPHVFFYRSVEDLKEPHMGLFFYLVMFVVACGFGWWAKGSQKSG